MANSLLTPTMVTREALRVLHQKLNFIGSINRSYDESFAKTGAKIGDSLKIRLPNQYVVRTGATLSAQDTTENSVTLQVATQKGVDLNFTSVDLTLSLDDFSARIIEPAMAVLASNIEADAFNMYKDVYQQVGTAGTIPNNLKVLNQARAKMTDSLTPAGDRSVCLNTDAQVELVDAVKGLFQDSSAIAQQYRDGLMGRTAGFGNIYENTIIPVHTNGTMGGTPLVNGASQTGATIAIDGLAASGTVTKGTVFTLAGVFSVHPETKVSTGKLQQFVVTADATASSGAIAALAISPSIVTSGATQNVTGSAADNAAVTFVGSASTGYAQNMAFHKDAFAFVTADLVKPDGVDWSARETIDGLSIRMIRQYDINNDKFPCRLDILYGYKAVRPQMACRITA